MGTQKPIAKLVRGFTNDDISTGEKFIKYDYGPQGNLEHYGIPSFKIEN